MKRVSFDGAIIAAGRGERLRLGGEDLPKPLVALDGRPLLVRQADEMLEAGATRVLAIVNSETARLLRERALKLPALLSLRVADTANSMESLFELAGLLSPGKDFLLATVDAVMKRDEFKAFVAAAPSRMAFQVDPPLGGVLGITRWRGDRRPLFVESDGQGLITRLGGSSSDFVTAGVYFFSTRIFDFKDRARRARLGAMREFLAMLVEAGMRLGAIEVRAAIDIDEAGDLEAARAMLAAARG